MTPELKITLRTSFTDADFILCEDSDEEFLAGRDFVCDGEFTCLPVYTSDLLNKRVSNQQCRNHNHIPILISKGTFDESPPIFPVTPSESESESEIFLSSFHCSM